MEKLLQYGHEPEYERITARIRMYSCTIPSRTIEALYVVNKKAKQIDSHTHSGGFKTSEKEQTLRKSALYEVKKEILSEIHDESNRVELHIIHGDEYYCLYFDDWSFHVPKEEFTFNGDVDGLIELEDFDTDSTQTRTTRSLEDSLRHIYERYGINANDYLSQKIVYTDLNRQKNVQWDFLEAA